MKRLIFTMMAESLNKSLPIASSAGGAIVCSVSFRSLFISFVWQRYGKRHKKDGRGKMDILCYFLATLR